MKREEEINVKWNALYFQSNHRYDERTFKENTYEQAILAGIEYVIDNNLI